MPDSTEEQGSEHQVGSGARDFDKYNRNFPGSSAALANDESRQSFGQQDDGGLDQEQLSAISQMLMDDTFLGMDRIISFDEMASGGPAGRPGEGDF